MAYETMTYEYILNRMMERVNTLYPNLDRREGSIVFNALAPAAFELAIAYTELNNATRESFVSTASREYILQGCKDIGIDVVQFYASNGVHKAIFNVEVPIGSRWNCEIYNYTVSEYMGLENGLYAYRMVCDTEGTAPNNTTGELTAISDFPSGLQQAELVECLVEGENETSDEDIVTAYYDYVKGGATNGNVAQYHRWCSEYDGIGNYKIFPLWNGDNTVKVSILSTSNRAASEELIAEFQEYLDPNISGMGDGVAPLGAFVTVTTASESPITISANVVLGSGYSDTTSIDTALSKYLGEMAYTRTLLSYMNIGAAILAVEGVESINNLLINGGTDDITLGVEEIPILGTTEWVVT